jgi:ABC-type multidrug transport system fused ATPase/permease subunit
LRTIRKSDLVLVLDRGRIVKRGTHQSLLRDDGVYVRLHREFIGSND